MEYDYYHDQPQSGEVILRSKAYTFYPGTVNEQNYSSNVTFFRNSSYLSRFNIGMPGQAVQGESFYDKMDSEGCVCQLGLTKQIYMGTL